MLSLVGSNVRLVEKFDLGDILDEVFRGLGMPRTLKVNLRNRLKILQAANVLTHL
jgi:hypothetical protein